MAGFIYEGTAENFDQLVLANSRKGPVVVDFWAPWAGPCQRQRTILTGLADKHQGRFLLVTVNTDREKPLAEQYGVAALPSLRVFRHGRVVDQFHGMQIEADYAELVERHLGLGGDPVEAAAARAWQAGDHDEALKVLAEGAVADPDNLSLPQMMSKFLIQLERHEDAANVLDALPAEARDLEEIATLRAHVAFLRAARDAPAAESLDVALAEDPNDCDLRWQRAALHLMVDEYEPALKQLMEILRLDRHYRDNLAQRGLLALFSLLNDQDELIKKYRAELFRLIH